MDEYCMRPQTQVHAWGIIFDAYWSKASVASASPCLNYHSPSILPIEYYADAFSTIAGV